MDEQTDWHTDRWTQRQMDGQQIDKQTDGQTHRWVNRQIGGERQKQISLFFH